MRARHFPFLHARWPGRDRLPGTGNAVRCKTALPSRQRGVSLFVVLIIMLLALIIVLGGLAVATLNEALTGNQSDAQRAYGAAQALINAAETDIRLNGRYCFGASGFGQTGGKNANMGTSTARDCTWRFPRDAEPDDLSTLQDMFSPGTCTSTQNNANLQGICFSAGPNDPNFNVSNVGVATGNAESINTGANYLSFIGSVQAADSRASVDVGTNKGGLAIQGQYWIEVFSYGAISGAGSGVNTTAIQGFQSAVTPVCSYPYVFRITARAQGLKGGTVSVLRTYYIPYANNGGGCG